jgi:hypothetical protein
MQIAVRPETVVDPSLFKQTFPGQPALRFHEGATSDLGRIASANLSDDQTAYRFFLEYQAAH